MASLPTIKELRAMQPKDLRTEIGEQQRVMAKLRLDIALQSEKDTAKLRRVRRFVAQAETVLSEKSEKSQNGAVPELKKTTKASRVPAHRSSKSEGGAAPNSL